MTEQYDLDQLFRQARETEPYLDDAGFTSGVMARLPEQPHMPTWLSHLITAVAVFCGVGIFSLLAPVSEWVSEIPHYATTLSTLVAAGSVSMVLSGGLIWMSETDRI